MTMAEIMFGKMPCSDTCPFAHMCGDGFARDEKECVTNIDKAVPGIDNVVASGNNLEAKQGAVRIARIRSGVVTNPY